MARRVLVFLLAVAWLTSCASQPPNADPAEPSSPAGGDTPLSNIKTFAGVTLGEPVAVASDFGGNLLVADRAPGQVVHLLLDANEAVEFDPPPTGAAFYPSDLNPSGFFVYVVDAAERVVLRFYKTGSYMGVLIDLNERFPGRRVTPSGLAVDGSGRIALTDVKNHQIIIFNTYLDVELQFGSYGQHAGQLDSPQGVFFTPGGGLLVTDSGNRRVQLFDSDGGFVRTVPADTENNPLRRPRRAVIDREGSIYVADPEAGGVFVFDGSGALTRRISPSGVAEFRPTDVAVAANGMIYVTDAATSALYTFR